MNRRQRRRIRQADEYFIRRRRFQGGATAVVVGANGTFFPTTPIGPVGPQGPSTPGVPVWPDGVPIPPPLENEVIVGAIDSGSVSSSASGLYYGPAAYLKGTIFIRGGISYIVGPDGIAREFGGNIGAAGLR